MRDAYSNKEQVKSEGICKGLVPFVSTPGMHRSTEEGKDA